MLKPPKHLMLSKGKKKTKWSIHYNIQEDAIQAAFYTYIYIYLPLCLSFYLLLFDAVKVFNFQRYRLLLNLCY